VQRVFKPARELFRPKPINHVGEGQAVTEALTLLILHDGASLENDARDVRARNQKDDVAPDRTEPGDGSSGFQTDDDQANQELSDASAATRVTQ
jgi:hypothetical protein